MKGSPAGIGAAIKRREEKQSNNEQELEIAYRNLLRKAGLDVFERNGRLVER